MRARRGRLVAVFVAVTLSFACLSTVVFSQGGSGAGTSTTVPSGTKRMVETLKRLDVRQDVTRHGYANDRRAQYFYEQAMDTTDVALRTNYWFRYADEQIRAGNLDIAIKILLDLREKATEAQESYSQDAVRVITRVLASAYFREGERDNCVARHSVDSCIMPVQGDGVHLLKEGSQAAIREWTTLLEMNPDDLKSRWLLNLAHMTLGQYPEQVPASQRIDPKVFESEHPIPRFLDVAPQCGLAKVGHAGGCVTEDFDGDGYIDVFSSSWELDESVRCFRNNADGTFADVTEVAGLSGITGGLNISHADYDNDGDVDILVLRGAWLFDQGRHPNSLLRNNGDGTFEDVTESAGLLSFHPTQVGVWADYDNDGWIDLFIGNENTPQESHASELYHNNGDGTFTNLAGQVGVTVGGYVKGAAWGDIDNDGLEDLYVARIDGPNILFRNEGPADPDNPASWRFTDVTLHAGVGMPLQSFPTWFWDYDNDGWHDILVASYPTVQGGRLVGVVKDYLGQAHNAETVRLYRNDGRSGSIGFTDVTESTGFDHLILAMGANFGDLDNDGWLDAYFGTGEPELTTLVPNRMFRNDGGKRFQDVTTAGGFGHLQKGHGISFVDLDNDGDQDIYAVMGGAYTDDTFQSALFENPGFGHHWITLRLEGVRSNRSAVGARIRVEVDTPNGSRDIHATVTSGGSFGSSSFQQEIGLGDATGIRVIDIRWPASGIRQRFTDVAMDQILHIKETANSPAVVSVKSFNLSPEGRDAPPCCHGAESEEGSQKGSDEGSDKTPEKTPDSDSNR